MTLKDQLGVVPVSIEVPFLNCLFYAESGVGKTRLAGSAAEVEGMYPLLFVDIEGGTTSLRALPAAVRKRIDVKRVSDRKEIETLHNELVKDTSGFYKCCVLDSGTEIQDKDMITIMREVVNRDPDRDPDVPSQREWGITRSHMRKIIRGYRDLPMHTIITALVLTIEEEGKQPRYYPSFPGKLKSEAAAFMDIVGYMHKNDNQVRTIQFEGTKRVIAKDRTDVLPAMMEDPTMSKIMDIVKNGGTP